MVLTQERGIGARARASAFPDNFVGAGFGVHLYQPLRDAAHRLLRGISTDPQGEDWNLKAIEACYSNLALGGALQNMPFDAYGSLRGELAVRAPDTFKAMVEAMQRNGIGDSFSHDILPDLTPRDKRILIGAGKDKYRRDVGRDPVVFWGAESAYDTDTLEALVDFKYSAFVCAPEQIFQFDGDTSDSRPTRIKLPSGRSIIAIPFDRGVSSAVAWDQGQRINADVFVENQIRPALYRNRDRSLRRGDNSPNVFISFTDGETFGLHDPNGHLFAIYLSNEALRNHNIEPISINDLVTSIASSHNRLPEGRLLERTAWSCSHGLDRWSKGCSCTNDKEPWKNSWKFPFYEAGRKLNDAVSEILERELHGHEEILMQTFDVVLANPGKPDSTQDKSLLSAKASSLVARTSCGTFFADPWTSGYINIIFGLQAILHLEDAGVPQAGRIKDQFLKDLGQAVYNGISARSIAERMLNGEKVIGTN